jgi:hypothetical protein
MLKAVGRQPEHLAKVLREIPGIGDDEKSLPKIEELAKEAASAEKHLKVTATPPGVACDDAPRVQPDNAHPLPSLGVLGRVGPGPLRDN